MVRFFIYFYEKTLCLPIFVTAYSRGAAAEIIKMTRCIKVIYKSFLRRKFQKNPIRKSLVNDLDTPCTLLLWLPRTEKQPHRFVPVRLSVGIQMMVQEKTENIL